MSTRYSRRDGIESAPLHAETVLFDPRMNRFCVLNRTGAAIWSRLESGGTPADLAAGLCASFEGLNPSAAERDVAEFLQEMVSLDLVVPTSPGPAPEERETTA
ncbi:MAG TPA: PqqD family protein [Vicinamibacteria bacterium]|nr:PqqD family protein [Vicinamibacteria bacterium]